MESLKPVVPHDKRVFLLNTGETVEGNNPCLGIRIDKDLIMTFEDKYEPDQQAYMHILRKKQDSEAYEYYAADMDFKLNPDGTIVHRTLYGAATCGRQPVLSVDPGVGQITVLFNPTKLTWEEVVSKNSIVCGLLEFSENGSDYEGTITGFSQEGVDNDNRINFILEPFKSRTVTWKALEKIPGKWHRQGKQKVFSLNPGSVSEQGDGSLLLIDHNHSKRARLTLAKE